MPQPITPDMTQEEFVKDVGEALSFFGIFYKFGLGIAQVLGYFQDTPDTETKELPIEVKKLNEKSDRE